MFANIQLVDSMFKFCSIRAGTEFQSFKEPKPKYLRLNL